MAAKFSTIKKLSILICICSLIAISFGPSMSQAEESQDSMLMLWTPISYPKAVVFISPTTEQCGNGLEGLLEGRCGQIPFTGLINTMIN